MKQIVTIFQETPVSVIASCWTRSIIKALHPSGENLPPKMTEEEQKTLEKHFEDEAFLLMAQPVDDAQEVEIDSIVFDKCETDQPTSSQNQGQSDSDTTDDELEGILSQAYANQAASLANVPTASTDNTPSASTDTAPSASLDTVPSASLDIAPSTTVESEPTAAADHTGLTQVFDRNVTIGQKKKKSGPIKNQPKIDTFFAKKK